MARIVCELLVKHRRAAMPYARESFPADCPYRLLLAVSPPVIREGQAVLIIVGTLVTLLSVFGGYALAGGHLGALIQPVEILMIVGAGVGAFILGNGGKTIKATLRVLPALFRGSKHEGCLHGADGASLRAAREGTQGRHAHARGRHRRSGKSPIFTQYPKILADHHIVEFLTDYLRLMVGGNMNAFEIESLMDEEIETHRGRRRPAHARSATRCRHSVSSRP